MTPSTEALLVLERENLRLEMFERGAVLVRVVEGSESRLAVSTNELRWLQAVAIPTGLHALR